MKKSIIKDIAILIIGMLLVGVPVMASCYIPSKDISYRTDYNENVTNVEEALDILTNQVKEIKTSGDSLASDILSGKTAYVNGKLLTGSMANYSGLNTTVNNIIKNGENAEITIPGGYYDGDSKITIPIDTINSNLGGKISKFTMSNMSTNGYPYSSLYLDVENCNTLKIKSVTFKNISLIYLRLYDGQTIIADIHQSSSEQVFDISQYKEVRITGFFSATASDGLISINEIEWK